MKLTKAERDLFRPWINRLSGDDLHLRELLWCSLGRIALNDLSRILESRGQGRRIKLGDIPASKPLFPEISEEIAAWLKAALSNQEPWLNDTDVEGRPVRLMQCADYMELLEEARKPG
jgi:hypothetical protein